MALKLVPFNDSWINHPKLDLHAIYRRPRYIVNDMDETVQAFDEHGVPQWDITTPLPVKQHNKWNAKGFQYITLATRGDLYAAAKLGTLKGSVKEYDQHQTGGPWHYKLYAQGQDQIDTVAAQQLREDVLQFGSAAVEALRRRADPNFRLPAELRGLGPQAGAKPPDEPVVNKRRGRPRKDVVPTGDPAEVTA